MRFCVLVALDLIHRTTRGRWGLFVIFGSWWVALDLIHRTTRGRWGLCDCGVLVIFISRRRLAATSPMTFGRWNARSMATFDRNRERRPQRARLVGRESYPAKKNSPRH